MSKITMQYLRTGGRIKANVPKRMLNGMFTGLNWAEMNIWATQFMKITVDRQWGLSMNFTALNYMRPKHNFVNKRTAWQHISPKQNLKYKLRPICKCKTSHVNTHGHTARRMRSEMRVFWFEKKRFRLSHLKNFIKASVRGISSVYEDATTALKSNTNVHSRKPKPTNDTVAGFLLPFHIT